MGEQAVDQQLIERIKKGEKEAFDVLVLKYQNKVVKLISRYVHDQSEALDVAQEAFIKAYRAIPSFRGDSAFYTWLYRIAINTAKNHLVSQGRRPPAVDVEVLDAEQFDGSTDLKDYGTPEEYLIRDEVEKTILEAMEALPDDLRTAITLREIEGLSYEEIADAMTCPVGTVRSRIFRAREAINSRLDKLLAD
ncbi:MAG: RNA polymerase sigma factor RpoE [Gammaproteobacteria bacterium]|nr:RNA polymerase sigma factor RpoE [Gammaproteobacteria bacterium]